MSLGLGYIIHQMNKVFGSIEPTPTYHKNNADNTSKAMNEIVRTHERNKRNIINPMLKGLR